jgi:VCBS repeat-containing protein
VAVAQAISTAEDVATSGQVEATDADGDALTYALVGQATRGTAVVNADGSFTYTPSPDANGADSFTFRANDGTADSNVATVTIAVTPINDAPVRTSAAPTLAAVDEDSFNVTAVPLGLGGLTYAPAR